MILRVSKVGRLKLSRIENDDYVLPVCFSADFRSPAKSFLFDFLGDVNMRRVSYGWAWEEARAMPFVNFGGRCQVVFQPEVIILAD